VSKNIIFTKVLNVSDQYSPKPSSSFLPEWYKKTSSYIGDSKEPTITLNNNSTIKRCIPVFDVLTAGYIIPTYEDLWIIRGDNGSIFYKTSSEIEIEFHTTAQAPYHPYMNQHPYPKWINPWSITTPKGYSCLFITPVHGGNNFFSVIEGIVDTDKYTAPVNFPFVLKDINFEGLIPAGTPMVQVIPFKRDSWTHSIEYENKRKKIQDDFIHLKSKFFDRYKSLFWERKNFKWEKKRIYLNMQ